MKTGDADANKCNYAECKCIRNGKGKKKLSQILPSLGKDLLLTQHKWTLFWVLAARTKSFWVFLGSSLLPIWGTLCSAGCNQAATGAVLVVQTWLQNLCPLPAATTAWCLHPSSCQPAAYKPQLAPSCCFPSLSLGHCSLSRFGNQAAWKNLSFSLVTFPYSVDIFPLIWETGAMGDLLGGSACWVKVLLLQATSCMLNRERQGGRKSHCWACRRSFSQQMEKASGVCSFLQKTAMPCLLMTHF